MMRTRFTAQEDRLNKVALAKMMSGSPRDILAQWLGVQMRKGETNTQDFSDVYYMHALLVGMGSFGDYLLPDGFKKSEVDPPTLARMMYERL